MSFADYWERVRSQPDNKELLEAKKISMTPAAFKEFCHTVYSDAYDAGYEDSQRSKSLFERIFG